MIDPKKYFSFVIAAILVIAIAIGTFFYGVLTKDSEEGELVSEEIYVEYSDEGMTAIPSGDSVPTHAPSVPAPDFAP